jgi:hypothetical protein
VHVRVRWRVRMRVWPRSFPTNVAVSCATQPFRHAVPFKRQPPDCGQFGNCTTCTGKGGCGWCLQPTGNSLLNGSCVPGEDSGPTNFLTCSRWFYQDCHSTLFDPRHPPPHTRTRATAQHTHAHVHTRHRTHAHSAVPYPHLASSGRATQI